MNAPQILEELKGEGYRVRVQHLRRATNSYGDKFTDLLCMHEIRECGCEVVATGGETRVSIETTDGFSGVNGVAACSVEDNFCRRTGLEIALDRALKALEGKIK